jgi:AbiV family abortive infection protein
MSKDVIPHSKLDEGLSSCKIQIKTLLDSCDLLYSKRKYSTSISLSILAYEELSKMQFLIDHYDHNQSISKKEWQKLKQHRKKLGYVFGMGMEIISGLPDSSIESVENERGKLGFEKNSPRDYEDGVAVTGVKNLLNNLNIVKQDGFYVDWNFNDFQWDSLFLKFTTNELKSIAYLLLTKSKSLFFQQLMEDEKLKKNLTREKILKSAHAKKIKILNKELEMPKNKQMIHNAFQALNQHYSFMP